MQLQMSKKLQIWLRRHNNGLTVRAHKKIETETVKRHAGPGAWSTTEEKQHKPCGNCTRVDFGFTEAEVELLNHMLRRYKPLVFESWQLDHVRGPGSRSAPDPEKVRAARLLNALPQTQPEVFKGSMRHFARSFRRQRAKVAHKLQNQRIHKITFHTLRHWKTTMEYAVTKDILHVMKLLGHRSIQNTLLYTQLVNFESDQFHSAVAKSIEEAQKLVEAGFEYVCDFNEVKLFRKRK